MKTKNCECCGGIISAARHNSKYCSSCAIYLFDLRCKLSNCKRRIKELKMKLIRCNLPKEIIKLKESLQ